jgi:hypothetical protein
MSVAEPLQRFAKFLREWNSNWEVTISCVQELEAGLAATADPGKRPVKNGSILHELQKLVGLIEINMFC